MAAPRSPLLLTLLLVLGIQVQHQVTSVPLCLVNNVILQCQTGAVILVQSAFLGVSEGHDPFTGNCPKTSDKCHQPTNRLSQLCNGRQICALAYPRDTVINLPNGCGLTNYIDMTYSCVQVSTVIDICDWSGERSTRASYIVSEHYPLAIPQQPHRCHCAIQKQTDSTALRTGVTLIVKDAYFVGSNCQQKLYVEFAGHSTQSNTVCSSSQRVTARTIFSRSSIQNGEIITLSFDKVRPIADAGTFVIEVQVTGLVAINCIALASPIPSPSTSSATSASSGGPITTLSDAVLTTPTTKPPSQTTGSTSTPPYQNDFSTTLAEQRADGVATGLGVGIAVGVTILVATAIVIFILRRRKHLTSGQDNPTQTSMEQHPPLDNNVTGNDDISEIPAVYDAVYEGPRDQYEQLHGVTSSTPVTYENVQGSNYEALDVPQSVDGNGPRDTPYENIRRAAEPEADSTGYTMLT